MRFLPGRPLVAEVCVHTELLVMNVLDAVIEGTGIKRKILGYCLHGRHDGCRRLVRDDCSSQQMHFRNDHEEATGLHVQSGWSDKEIALSMHQIWCMLRAI